MFFGDVMVSCMTAPTALDINKLIKNLRPKGLSLALKPKEASMESARKATYRVKLQSL